VVAVRERDHEDPDRGVPRPRPDLLEGRYGHRPQPDWRVEHLHLFIDRRGWHGVHRFASFPHPAKSATATLYVSHSSDDGQTFSPFVAAATAGTLPACCLPNTNFRDGITESFAASPTYPGHLYLAYENWDGTQMDVKFTQSADSVLPGRRQ
jgi:hypothetical protein